MKKRAFKWIGYLVLIPAFLVMMHAMDRLWPMENIEKERRSAQREREKTEMARRAKEAEEEKLRAERQTRENEEKIEMARRAKEAEEEKLRAARQARENEESSLAVTRPRVPTLTIQKTGPEEGILGEKIVYTLSFSPGEAAADKVLIQDTLPKGFSYLESTLPPTSVKNNVLTWNIGTLPKGERKFELTVKAEETGTWTNMVTIASQEGSPQTCTTVTRIGAPKLFILKSGPSELRKGQLANYIVTAKNKGNAVARDVFIRNFIPAGMKYKEVVKGTSLRWNIGDLQPGQQRVFQYTLETPNVGTFINEARVFMRNQEESLHKASWKTIVVAPSLKIKKEGQGVISLNKSSEYTITITNEGNGCAKDMVLVDLLPRNLEYIDANPRGVFRPAKGPYPATIIWKFGDIPANQSLVIKVEVKANAIGRCTHSVKLRSDSQEPPEIKPLEASCDIDIIGVPAMHINSYDTEDPVEIGKQTTYVIEARNKGPLVCTNVKLENQIDEEMELVSASGPTSYRFEGKKIVFEPFPLLHPGEKVVYKIVCKAVKEGAAKNTATLTYDQFSKPIMDEESTSVY